MKIIVKNINKIHSAEINLNGLTVVTGVNDSGKSTLSKVLFSTIKAVASIERNSNESKEVLIGKHIRSLYGHIKDCNTPFFALEKFRELFPIDRRQFLSSLMALNTREEINLFCDERLEFLSDELRFPPRILSFVRKDLDNISLCLLDNENPAAMMAAEIRSFVESEFVNRITSNDSESSYVSIKQDDETDIISYKLVNDEVREVYYNTDVIEGFFKDATYVESPLYLHMIDALRRAGTYYDINPNRVIMPMVAMHIKDLVEKLDSLYITQEHDLSVNDQLEHISNVTLGQFVFDEERRQIYFNKDGRQYSPMNVASGIKNFGVLQILLQTGVISPDRPLLWDEPENHMHPDWQIRFAEIIVQLVKSGIPILISTHSPYFTQSIRYYSAKYNIGNFVDYYMAEEKDDGLSVIENVTNDLNRVFVRLAAPLREIMNIPNIQ